MENQTETQAVDPASAPAASGESAAIPPVQPETSEPAPAVAATGDTVMSEPAEPAAATETSGVKPEPPVDAAAAAAEGEQRQTRTKRSSAGKRKDRTIGSGDAAASESFEEGGRAWVLEDVDEYEGGFAHGLFNHELRKKTVNPDGSVVWEAHTLGFFEDEKGTIPLIKKNISERKMFRLTRPMHWAPELGDLCLGWKVVDNEPPGAWWIGRVVRMEWSGLYDGENETIYTVQWLVVNGWESDQSQWDKLRSVCILPFPEKLNDYIKPYIA